MSCDGRPAFDIDPAVVNQATGAPMVGSIMVTSGGPSVNALIKYYEDDGATPVYFGVEYPPSGTEVLFYDSDSGDPIEDTRQAYSDIGQTFDMFVIMIWEDDGTSVINIYGVEGRGTYAGAQYFYFNFDFFEGKTGVWVFEWYDDPADGSIYHPDYGDADDYVLIYTSGA
jgi:hypothetical protein